MCDLDVAQVANYFIEKSWEQKQPLTFIKLTDLLWQANGFYIALTSRPLFSEKFSNSKKGVLLLSVFEQFKDCNNNPIFSKFNESDFNDNKINSEKYQILLDKIWRMFAKFPQDFLRYLSSGIYKYNKNLTEYSEIDDDIIIECFRDKLKEYGIEV